MEELSFYSEILNFAKQHYILTALWVLALGYLIKIQIQLLIDSIHLIEPDKAIMMVNHDEAVFVDTRKSEDYKKAHIANSVLLSSSDILIPLLDSIAKYKNQTIIVVGKSFDDMEAYNSAKILKKNGFKVELLNGGIQDWVSRNLPLTK